MSNKDGSFSTSCPLSEAEKMALGFQWVSPKDPQQKENWLRFEWLLWHSILITLITTIPLITTIFASNGKCWWSQYTKFLFLNYPHWILIWFKICIYAIIYNSEISGTLFAFDSEWAKFFTKSAHHLWLGSVHLPSYLRIPNSVRESFYNGNKHSSPSPGFLDSFLPRE